MKVVVCGAGFLGSNIARVLATASKTNPVKGSAACVQLSSRKPEVLHSALKSQLPPNTLLDPVPCNVRNFDSLQTAFKDASFVVSLVGIMYGTVKDFEEVQWKGAENVAKACKRSGAKLVHISAIGADPTSDIPYNRTKGLAESAVLEHCPDATIIRPSLVFGPGDSFFKRFSSLSTFLPFLPVFGGGTSRFQPVYVGDLARAVEIICRDDPKVREFVDGKILEAGGPEVFTYKEIMELVLKYNGRHRPIVSLPFAVGKLQGAVLERLPQNIFTVTSSQVEQLKSDNVVSSSADDLSFRSFKELIEKFSGDPLKSVHEILPTYL